MILLNPAADLAASINAATTSADLDQRISDVWSACEKGEIDSATAIRLDDLGLARRDAMAPTPSGRFARAGAAASTLAHRPRPRPRSPDRAASIARRRRVDASGGLPPRLAEHFTEGQRAALTVVGREAAAGRPWCDWPMDKIAALAGVGRTTVRNALRLAQLIGLLRVKERRRSADRSDTNLVWITAKSWWGWLRRRGSGRKKVKPSDTQESTCLHNTLDGGRGSGLRTSDNGSTSENEAPRPAGEDRRSKQGQDVDRRRPQKSGHDREDHR